ncbi:MAG: GrpB family protein [Chloroflexota bacterium]|nr:GrpB family protein [Chloroflexota bacterium]
MTSRTGKPIIIADYDPAWPLRFERERELILRTCGAGPFVRIEHMGSTAVPGLAAKPIIDMMPGLRTLDDAPPLIPRLQSFGYEYVPEFEQPNDFDEGMPERRYFRKDLAGERAFHMHMVAVTSDFWGTHLLFRNFLRISPEDMREYERVKRRVAAEYNATLTPQSNMNAGYTDKKSDCVNGILAKARTHIAEGRWDGESSTLIR